MDKINYSEVLFQSIDQIVEERLKQVQYDKTIACEILEAHPEENLYWVNCEGLKIQVSSIDPKKTYSKNTLVYVLVPNGNYENTKVIIGGYSTKDIEKKTYNNSYDNFIPNKTFYVIDENNPIVLSVKNLKVQETDAISYSPIQYNREYDYVGVHWSMQTYQLFDANITSGQYTLEIVFGNQTDDAIVSYPIHSSSIYGNPYSLSEDFEQYTLFPYSDKLNTCTHFKIRLYQGIKDETNPENRIDKFNYTGTDNPEIILCSLDLSVGYANTDFTEEQSLSIGKYESLNYKLNDSNSLERTLYFDWRIIDKNKDNQIFNYSNNNFDDFINNAHIYWLQYQENEGYKSFKDMDFDYTSIEGLYNWKILPENENIFKRLINIDTDYQTDQYKVFIIYDHWITTTDEQGNEKQEQYSDYAFTNTIVFENLDIAPIQPGAATADKPNSLNLTLNDGNTGVYNVYGLDGRMVESSKQGPYYITASLYDSLQDKINQVEWIFPSSNTMIVDARDDGWDNLSNNDKLTVKYKIKTQYYSSATFNIIQCKITMNTGEIRNASVSLQFGEVGNQGTNYAFNIDFIDKDHLTYGQDEEVQIKATLSNQNGEEVLLEDFIDKLQWSWLFVENPDVIKEDSNVTNITSISNIVCSKYENNIVKLKLGDDFDFSQANYSILQAKLKEYNTGDNIKTDLLTYLCVPVAATDTATIKPRSMQGATRVVYDSLGTATTYSKETYELINEDNTQVADLTWELFTDTKYSGLPALTESKVKKQNTEKYINKYKIKPSSYVPPKIPPVAIVAKQGNIICWSQPILITQNTWFNESINEWTNVLSINQQNDGTILAPLLIAGTKTSNNLFSGVTVGQLAIGSKKVNGVYGFAQGKARFWLNEDAEFFIGKGEEQNIYFKEDGSFSIAATSFDLETTDQNLILSSTNGKFYISDGTNYLQFEKEIKEGETVTRNSVFKIKANEFEFDNAGYDSFDLRVSKTGFYTGTEDEYISFEKENDGSSRALKISAKDFEFNSTNYNGFSMRVGKEGFYTGTADEYISFEKEDGSYYRTLRIQAKNFELETDYITLSSNEHYLLIKRQPGSEEKSDERVRVGAIKKRDGAIVYGLDIYGGALRVYTKDTKDKAEIPKLWIQDSNIYLSGRITNDVAPEDWNEDYVPHTWMTMGYPETSEGSDGGSGFRIFNTGIYSSTIPVFKIWPGYVGGQYNSMMISGYKQIKLCPYVIPNNTTDNSYSSYLEVNTSGGGMSEKWILYSSHRFSGDVRTKNSLAICRSDDDYNTYDLHLWSDNSNNGVVDAPAGNLSLRSKNYSVITGTTTGGTLHGAWAYGTLSGGLITASALNLSDNGSYSVYRTTENTTAVKGVSGTILVAGSDTKLEVNSSGGNLYGTWSAFCYGTVNGKTSNWYSFKTHLNGGRLYGTWYEGNSSTAITSDRNLKNSITSLEEKYEILFDNLIPIKYKYNQGTSSRFHTGFIAQDVESAITLADLTAQDFAGLVFDTEEQSYYLRYDEFISLNTWQIQKLKTRVTELENEIKEIKQRYEI